MFQKDTISVGLPTGEIQQTTQINMNTYVTVIYDNKGKLLDYNIITYGQQ